MNLIKEYYDAISPILDAPKTFIEASAYHLVSVLLGQFCVCSSAPGMNGLRPNAWIIISSIPARGRRSTVANYHNTVYELASRKFYEDSLTIGHDEALTRVKETYIEEGTKEGIIDHIYDSDFRTYYINSTEFGAVLKNMTTKEHEMDLASLFSKMYYGEGGVYHLSKRGKENKEDSVRVLKEGKYCTMFCGMQEPYLYITPGMMHQGLIRRILLIYADKEDFGTWIPPISDVRLDIYPKLQRLGMIFYNKMNEFNRYTQGRRDPNRFLDRTLDFDIHPKAAEAINNYSEALDKELRENVSNVTIYKQTLWEHLAKYAFIHSIARCDLKIIGEGVDQEVIGRIDPVDVEAASKFLKSATKYSELILGEIGRVDSPIRTSHSPLDRVYGLIRESKRISRSDLYKKTKMISRDLDEYLKTLCEQDMVDVEILNTGGRNKVFYVDKNKS